MIVPSQFLFILSSLPPSHHNHPHRRLLQALFNRKSHSGKRGYLQPVEGEIMNPKMIQPAIPVSKMVLVQLNRLRIRPPTIMTPPRIHQAICQGLYHRIFNRLWHITSKPSFNILLRNLCSTVMLSSQATLRIHQTIIRLGIALKMLSQYRLLQIRIRPCSSPASSL